MRLDKNNISLCSNLPKGMTVLSQEEELDFNGGSWIVVGGVLVFVGFVGSVGVGVYNGYNSTIERTPMSASSHASKSINLQRK